MTALRFAVIGINHAHIHGQIDCLLRAGAAFVGFQERKLGSLEPGKLADVTVLAEDPFSVPPEDFRDLPIDLTISGGRVVHRR